MLEVVHKKSVWILLILLACCRLWAAPEVKPIGPGLYAYISDNDSSANSTFLVGNKGILVVDTGFDAKEGEKLLKGVLSKKEDMYGTLKNIPDAVEGLLSIAKT